VKHTVKHNESGTNMTKELKKGDKVTWESSQGEITGEVEKKLSSPIEIKGHHVAASGDNPEYLVKSEKTGKEAAHKPESLRKIEE
jgi:Hypervirulence associated proteins TUDOR domain